MRNRTAMLCILSLLILSLGVGCSKTEAPKQEAPPAAPAAAAPSDAPAAGGAVADGKALFEQKCSVCHELARAVTRSETKEGWVSVVKEMQGKKAGWISDDEAAKIVAFLTAEHGKK